LELAVLTTSSKVQTIHDDQVTREKLQADLESANRTTREQSAALAQLEHHLETANTKSTELEQENTTITQLLTGKESRIVELEHHLGTANTRSTEPEQQNTTITQLLSSKESRIMELETDLAEASAENRRLLMTVDGMERERDVLRQFWTI
jgi:chromosome segregation ATPase